MEYREVESVSKLAIIGDEVAIETPKTTIRVQEKK